MTRGRKLARPNFGLERGRIIGSKRYILAACVAFLGSLGLREDASAQTLAEAFRLGLTASDRLQADQSSVVAAQEQRNQVAAQRRTRVQGELGLGTRRDTNEFLDFRGRVNERTVNTPRNTAAIFVSQPIYSGGRLREGMRSSDLRILAAETRLAATEITLLRTIGAVYFDVVRARTTAAIIADSLGAVAEDVRGARARYAAGEVSVTDVAQSEARQASVQAQYVRATADLTTASATFERFVGRPPGELDGELTVPDLPPSLEDFIQASFDTNLELLQSRLTLSQAEAAARAASAQRNPTVSLDTSYTSRWNETFSGSRASNTSVEARVVVPLWDGGATSARVRELLATANVNRLQVRDLESDVRLRATRLWSDLISARAQLQAAQIQVSAAELARRGAVAEQNFGLRSTIEALNQELELRQARIAQANAKRDLNIAIIDIKALLGQAADGTVPESNDPSRRSALPPPQAPRPGALERPLIWVQEFLEDNDKPLSRAMRDLNKALEPRQQQGPPL